MLDTSKSCFLHVPKTGGSWVSAALRQAVPPHAFYEVPSARVGQVPLEFLLNRYALVTGHFTVAQFIPAFVTAFTFTFLRDPIDRAISLYYFYRAQECGNSQDPRVTLAKTHEDFDSFVENLPARMSPWSNWQTFVFSGAEDAERPAEALLPAAREHLERFDFVGVHDALAESLAALVELRGWRVTPPATRVNATAHRPAIEQLAPSVIDKLLELNACDLDLFRLAQTRWATLRGSNHRPPRTPSSTNSVAPAAVSERGTKEIVITSAGVDVERGLVLLRAQSSVTAEDVTVGIRISDSTGVEVYGINTRMLGQRLSVRAGDGLDIAFRIDLPLAAGVYHLTAAIHQGADHLEKCYHWVDNVTQFTCEPQGGRHFSGLIDLHASVEVVPSPPRPTQVVRSVADEPRDP